MSADLGAVTYTSVTWTAGDVITEAKMDNMVANDQAYDSHEAQGLSLNNEKALAGKLASGTLINLVKLNSDDEQVSGGRDSGWNLVDQTWTYLSATTITIPAGGTTIYSKGDKIRLKQGAGWKYFYIVGVASTVLTVSGGTDYTVANSAITVPYYSHASSPIGFPNYFNTGALTWDTDKIDNGTGGVQPTQTASIFMIDGIQVTHYCTLNVAVKNVAGADIQYTLPSTMPPASTTANATTSGVCLLGGIYVTASCGMNPFTQIVNIRKYDGSNISDNQNLNSTNFWITYVI